MMTLFHHPMNARAAPGVSSSMLMHPETGVDIATGFTLTFPKIPAIAYCAFDMSSRPPSCPPALPAVSCPAD